MSLLDTITGGASGNASEDETLGLQSIEGITPPTQEQLTIPQLQQYVAAGVMTPAQAQAYMQNTNAYANVQLDPSSLSDEEQDLSQLQQEAQPGKAGDAETLASETQAEDTANRALQGQEGANILQAEQRGVAPQLAVMAANEQDIGNNAGAMFSADQTAAANEEARQLAALSAAGGEASTIQGQTSALANNKATAANAIAQFNTQNQNQNAQYNATNNQAANAYNAANTQAASDKNTGTNNATTVYNATQAPQVAFNDQLSKGEALEGAANNAAANQTAQGQQSAGLLSSLMGGLAEAGTAYEGAGASSAGGAGAEGAAADVGEDAALAAHGGEVDFKNGGIVPGQPKVPGDSPANDIVPAHVGNKNIRLSPGEVVVPRSLATQPDPNRIAQFLRSMPRFQKNVQPQPNSVHPHDVAKVLQALSAMRGGKPNA